jgi:hypothetical protein
MISSRPVRMLPPKLHVARTGRASAGAKLAAPLQHRPDNDDRFREIGRNQPGACPDALGYHSWLVENNGQGSAIDVRRPGRDYRAKAMFRVSGRGDDDPSQIEPVEDEANTMG